MLAKYRDRWGEDGGRVKNQGVADLEFALGEGFLGCGVGG